MNPLLILYFLFHFFFLFSTAAVVYHLLRYQLNKKVTGITTSLFLAGAAILLIMNVIISTQVEWSQFRIIF